MNWLIIEDALRDHKGHWLEYLMSFALGLDQLGDQRRILADREAASDIIGRLTAEAILPESIWHRMGDGAGPFRRLLRVPCHAWFTCRAVRKVLSSGDQPDVIYVPTVLPHHLLAYTWLVIRGGIPSGTVLLLYFLSCPIELNPATGRFSFSGGPTAHLMKALLRILRRRANSGQLVLGCETLPLRNALTEASGVGFTYLPQPVYPVSGQRRALSVERDTILMACYGPARHEKGSDVLQAAILRYLSAHPATEVRFVVHWIDDFHDTVGKRVSRDPDLGQDSRCTFLTHRLDETTYVDWLLKTDVMLLPYRLTSYGVRGSRVLIEALVNGIPVIVTSGTALAKQATLHGASIECVDGSVESLCDAIHAMVSQYHELRESARIKQADACRHFSVPTFRNCLLNATTAAGEPRCTGTLPLS